MLIVETRRLHQLHRKWAFGQSGLVKWRFFANYRLIPVEMPARYHLGKPNGRTESRSEQAIHDLFRGGNGWNLCCQWCQ